MKVLFACIVFAAALLLVEGQANCLVDTTDPGFYAVHNTANSALVVPGSDGRCPSQDILNNLRLPERHVVRIDPPTSISAAQDIQITIVCFAPVDAADQPCEASCGTVTVQAGNCTQECNENRFPGLLPACFGENFEGAPRTGESRVILIPAFERAGKDLFVSFIRNQRAAFRASITFVGVTPACNEVVRPNEAILPSVPVTYVSDASANSCAAPGNDYIQSITAIRMPDLDATVSIIIDRIQQDNGTAPCDGSAVSAGYAIGVGKCITCLERFNDANCVGNNVCGRSELAVGSISRSYDHEVLNGKTLFVTLCYKPDQRVRQSFSIAAVTPPSATPSPSTAPSSTPSPTSLPVRPNVECSVASTVSGNAPISQSLLYIVNSGSQSTTVTCWPAVTSKKRQAQHPLKICWGVSPAVPSNTVLCTDPLQDARPVAISLTFVSTTGVLPWFSVQGTTAPANFICRIDCSGTAPETLPPFPEGLVPNGKVDMPHPTPVARNLVDNPGFSYSAYGDYGTFDGLISPDIFSPASTIAINSLLVMFLTVVATLF